MCTRLELKVLGLAGIQRMNVYSITPSTVPTVTFACPFNGYLCLIEALNTIFKDLIETLDLSASPNLSPTMPPTAGEVLRASTLLTKFKARELSRQPVAMKQLADGSKIPEYMNPFLSTAKAANANKHSGSRYSLRRQKELLKAAHVLTQSGHPDANQLTKFLPPGPKTVTRVTGGGVDKALAALGRRNSTISVAGVSKVLVPADEPRVEEPSTENPEVIWRGTPRARKPIGMYEGRKVAFKRHIWERERKERQALITKQVESMEERISTWRNVGLISRAEFLITDLLTETGGENSGDKASVLDHPSFIYGF